MKTIGFNLLNFNSFKETKDFGILSIIINNEWRSLFRILYASSNGQKDILIHFLWNFNYGRKSK